MQAIISLFDLYGAQGENEFAVYNAVECSDVNWPRNWARWNRDARRVYRTAPFEAWDNTWFNAACAFWPVKGPAHPLPITGAGLPPILMLQGTLDAATPYPGAMQAHRLLPALASWSSRAAVTTAVAGHPAECPPALNGYLNRYLATGALPQGPDPVNATCAALPEPAPGG